MNLIRSDLFPRDPIETVEPLIHGGLTELSLRAHIVRYRDLKTGRRYFQVVNWHHQKINRPTRSTKPLSTSENVELIDDSVSAHGGLTEGSLQDLGNKGSREQGIGVVKDSSDPAGSDVSPIRPTAYPQAFEQWWMHYPRKDAKRGALKAWQRARKRATDQELINGAIRYAQDPNRDPQFTKQPTRWLDNDCWLSEQQPHAAPLNGSHIATSDLRVAQVQALKSNHNDRLVIEA